MGNVNLPSDLDIQGTPNSADTAMLFDAITAGPSGMAKAVKLAINQLPVGGISDNDYRVGFWTHLQEGVEYEFAECRLGDVLSSPWPSAMPAPPTNGTITLGSTVLEIQHREDTGLDTGTSGDWNNSTHPLTVTDAALASDSNVVAGNYICVDSEIMYIRRIIGNDVTLYRGRCDQLVAAHGNSQTIWTYRWAGGDNIPIPLGATTIASSLDSRIKDAIKQDVSMLYPALRLRARVSYSGYITFYRPASVDSTKTCSNTLVDSLIQPVFRPQFGVSIKGDHGGFALLCRETNADDFSFLNGSGRAFISMAADFNAIPIARWCTNSNFAVQEVGYSGGSQLVDPRVNDEYDIAICEFDASPSQVAGDYMAMLVMTEDAYPEYLRGYDPVSQPSIDDQQAFWGPDPHMPTPYV